MKIDKQFADSVIEQLAGAQALLTTGGGYGIRVVVTAEAMEGLRQSTHPYAQHVLANLMVDENEELKSLRLVAAEYDEWIRFHDAGNGDFAGFIKSRAPCDGDGGVLSGLNRTTTGAIGQP